MSAIQWCYHRTYHNPYIPRFMDVCKNWNPIPEIVEDRNRNLTSQISWSWFCEISVYFCGFYESFDCCVILCLRSTINMWAVTRLSVLKTICVRKYIGWDCVTVKLRTYFFILNNIDISIINLPSHFNKLFTIITMRSFITCVCLFIL